MWMERQTAPVVELYQIELPFKTVQEVEAHLDKLKRDGYRTMSTTFNQATGLVKIQASRPQPMWLQGR